MPSKILLNLKKVFIFLLRGSLNLLQAKIPFINKEIFNLETKILNQQSKDFVPFIIPLFKP